jgi:hypothetical protein
MNNADLPIAPIYNAFGYICNPDDLFLPEGAVGLTKLEHFACEAMKGLLARGDVIDSQLGRKSLVAANIVLAALEAER